MGQHALLDQDPARNGADSNQSKAHECHLQKLRSKCNESTCPTDRTPKCARLRPWQSRTRTGWSSRMSRLAERCQGRPLMLQPPQLPELHQPPQPAPASPPSAARLAASAAPSTALATPPRALSARDRSPMADRKWSRPCRGVGRSSPPVPRWSWLPPVHGWAGLLARALTPLELARLPSHQAAGSKLAWAFGEMQH